ncbi:ATP-binding cassette domain-containing protein [Paracoccus sp. YIM 132242]|uniref:ATP-binding cassette domain-containing protein n=1 Tax=Paracoccus lichenicola TaxID=2665644 RepID=A0A6L6HQP0_9RHOB|nr:ABC transporter ATP-binding protein [Paracoccus lichenicola]MTE01467.1 ATP-binding cassette domain-containing protein [Paracoccus lichenicola]
MPLLEVKGLSAAYGLVPALHRVDFYVDPGEVVGILGHNGMGKTTLMRAIMGFVKVTGGEIAFDGQSLLGQSVNARARAGIGLVPQGREIFPNLSVEENLQVGIAGAGGDMAGTVAGVLDLFPRLKRLLDRRGGALSGGEQQLLALARCLCRKPRLMLLDEPTEGIQPSINDEISETLQELSRRQDITIVLVEQNLDFITGLAQRVYAISNGVLDRQIPREQLTDRRAVSEFMGFVTA